MLWLGGRMIDGDNPRRLVRGPHIWPLLILLALVLSGCHNNGSPPPGVQAAVFAIVTGVWKLRNLHADKLLRHDVGGDPFTDGTTTIGEHVKFFLRWRAEAHLVTETNQDQITQAVAAEYDAVRAFVASSIGLDSGAPSTLITGSDKTPPHLDFTDVLRVKVEDEAVSDDDRHLEEVQRWKRAMNIAWRAAALENDLWVPNFSDSALREIVDRRLRMTERMLYQVSQDVGDEGHLHPSTAAPHGPWTDGVRVRMFEYPILDAKFSSRIGAANIGDTGIWRLDFTKTSLYYNEGNARLIRPEAVAEFTPAPGTTFVEVYPYDLVPGVNPAQAIDDLFSPSENWWDRSWIYCDHVLAALHLEALRFGKLRRDGSDATFNAAVNGHPKGWAELRPLLPPGPGDPRLLADDSTKPPGEPHLFRNGPVPQVQLGDHVVFWNSIMYGLLSDGAWSLENAVVVGIRSDWASNDVGDSLKLMGHGTAATSAGDFRKQLKSDLDEMLDAARLKVKNSSATDEIIPWLHAGAPLVRWAPFGEPWADAGGPQAPWWVRVPYEPTGDWIGRAIGRDATLHTLSDAVAYDPAAGFSEAPPAAAGDPTAAAYFPLWWPAQAGKWNGYIQRRKGGQVPSKFLLEPSKFDKKNIPGLIVPFQFIPGATRQQVFAVRPMVVR